MAADDMPGTTRNGVVDDERNLSSAPAAQATMLPPQTEINHSQPSNVDDRSPLLSRAHSLLHSPQISGRDLQYKRQFLREIGLQEAEIDILLRDAAAFTPLVPPRTYPQPPPSNLPNLFLGLSRVFSWLAGGSAIFIFTYYRFLLPRIARSYMARHSLKNHHLTLMRRLTASLSSFKESQAEVWSVLPRADHWREMPPYSKCTCIDDITISFGDQEPQFDVVSPVTILRCGLADLTKGKENDQRPTTEELFRYLEIKFPWLLSHDGLKYEQRLWEVLSSCPLFEANPAPSPHPMDQDPQPPSRWCYVPPLPPDPSPVVKSLSSLKLALPKDQLSKPSILQNMLQALSELTGYISTQVYMPYRPLTSSVGVSSNLNPIEEQLKREIRALKGLALNRRSFMPPTTRASTLPPTETTST